MTETFRKLMNFCRFVGLIIADKGEYGDTKKWLLVDYIYLKFLSFCPFFIKKSFKNVNFLGNKIGIFDLDTSVALIEAIFIENEYDFKAKSKMPVIYDLGSNIGISVLYFKIHFPKAKIIAFEADPITSRLLNNNLRNFKNVKIYNQAVSGHRGKINFYVDLNGPGSPLMSIYQKRLPKDSIKIGSVKLSGFINSGVDLVKMDIEGAETEVLKDLVSKKKMKFIKQFVFEYHHHIDPDTDNFSEFLTLLEANGFGYQIHASQRPPFKQKEFEDILIYAYNKAYFQPKKL